MAILKGINGLQVRILSPRNSYKEEYYDTGEEQPENVATQYIAAESGKDFHIEWHFQPAFTFKDSYIGSHVYLDGQLVEGMVFGPEHLQRQHDFKVTFSGAHVREGEKWYERPFLFADLIIDEDNCDINDTCLKEKVGCLGEISVRFWRIEETGQEELRSRLSSPYKPLNTVPKKALKGNAVSQRAHLGDARVPTHSVQKTIRARNIDPYDKPFAVFNFRYRSRSGLEALRLIAALEDRPIESLSNEELRELVRRQQEQLKAASQVKAEVKIKREQEDDDSSEWKIKREREDDDGAERKIKRQDHSHTSEEVETLNLTEV